MQEGPVHVTVEYDVEAMERECGCSLSPDLDDVEHWPPAAPDAGRDGGPDAGP